MQTLRSAARQTYRSGPLARSPVGRQVDQNCTTVSVESQETDDGEDSDTDNGDSDGGDDDAESGDESESSGINRTALMIGVLAVGAAVIANN